MAKLPPLPPPKTPAQLRDAARQRRRNELEKTAQGGSNPNLIADPNNPTWRLYFTHVPTGKNVSFPGWVTSFSDNYNSTWNEESVYGRMDPLATFQNTQRSISVSFDVVAPGLGDALQNTAMVDHLLSFLYPSYNELGQSDSNTLKAAPLMKLRWANLIAKGGTPGKELVGYMNGLSYTPDFDAGFFLDGHTMIPQLLRLSFEFKVIHTNLMGWTTSTSEEGTRATITTLAVTNMHGAQSDSPDFNADRSSKNSAINISQLEEDKRKLRQEKANEELVLMGEQDARRGQRQARRDQRQAQREADAWAFKQNPKLGGWM